MKKLFILLSITLLSLSVPGASPGTNNSYAETDLSSTAKLTAQTSRSCWELSGSMDLFGSKKGAFAFQTNKEQNPYIIITLEQPAMLTKIIIENTSVEIEKARTLTLWISEDLLNWKEVWKAAGKAEQTWTIDLKKTKVKYIKLGLLDNEQFHLSKVKIYGIKIINAPALKLN